MDYNGLPSVVLTSTYCDLMSDAKLFEPLPQANSQRNRRFFSILLLLAGAVMGGVFAHSRFGLTGALWLAFGCKALITITWLLWPAEKSGEDNE